MRSGWLVWLMRDYIGSLKMPKALAGKQGLG